MWSDRQWWLPVSVKQLDEMEHVQLAEELSPGLRERKESIDAELKSPWRRKRRRELSEGRGQVLLR